MIYEITLAAVLGILAGGVGGYYLGRYQTQLVDKIRTLTEQVREQPEPEPEPEKPTVAGGVYAPPTEISTTPDKRPSGLVETKTPELLEWERQVEIENLSTTG